MLIRTNCLVGWMNLIIALIHYRGKQCFQICVWKWCCRSVFMEWLEQEAIVSAPIECKPCFWRRCVDDILEIINKDSVEDLITITHLNQVDTSNSIKFTHEQENDGQIPFLDTLIVRNKSDGSIKLLVYRKNHTHGPIFKFCLSPPAASKVRCHTHTT